MEVHAMPPSRRWQTVLPNVLFVPCMSLLPEYCASTDTWAGARWCPCAADEYMSFHRCKSTVQLWLRVVVQRQ